MAGVVFIFGSPTCKASTNSPNLVDRIYFSARASGHCRAKGDFWQFSSASSGRCAVAAGLVDVPIFRGSAIGKCSMRLPRLDGRLPEASLAAQLANKFVGPNHVLNTPLSIPMTLGNTYIDWIGWTGMTAAGHVVEVKDRAGTLLARLVSAQANDSNFNMIPIQRTALNGYEVPVLDSGVLVVNTDRPIRNL